MKRIVALAVIAAFGLAAPVASFSQDKAPAKKEAKKKPHRPPVHRPMPHKKAEKKKAEAKTEKK